jgi:hypothetical protein
MNLAIDDALRAYLGVPETWKSYRGLPAGHAAETPVPAVR